MTLTCSLTQTVYRPRQRRDDGEDGHDSASTTSAWTWTLAISVHASPSARATDDGPRIRSAACCCFFLSVFATWSTSQQPIHVCCYPFAYRLSTCHTDFAARERESRNKDILVSFAVLLSRHRLHAALRGHSVRLCASHTVDKFTNALQVQEY